MAKKVKFNELSMVELKTKIRDFENDMVLLRMKKNQKTLKDFTEIPKLRKNIARAKTFLNIKKKVDPPMAGKSARHGTPSALGGRENA
ncbi:MAG: 50S ribosomal protein L29 [Elusimicrobia bacterium CG08_land_8_20_14_0_20_44_26]|nr:MAG: 50S ribosomal protein L29 [Elusimicrobia bacterium CG08_land_8_20_14_0_20_44_26]